MLDIKLIREKPDFVRQRLATRGCGDEACVTEIINIDREIRDSSTKRDNLKAEINRLSKEIGRRMNMSVMIEEATSDEKPSATVEDLKKQSKDLGVQVAACEGTIAGHKARLEEVLQLMIPNLPHESVPVGKEPADNPEVKRWGEVPKFAFQPTAHWDIGEKLGILDFARAAKISGSGFILYKGAGARLERALINFLLDLHTSEHGYTEVFPPFLINRDAMIGTGQLPKFEEDMYRLRDEDMYLAPTAEVPVANIHRDEILREEQLPIYYCAYTPCFRREAGAAGKQTRGMIRVHQFDKVEMIKFVKPESSYEELEKMLANAERVLQLLGLHYRVVLLCTGDMGFASAKTYDIEVWAPGQNAYLEVSSCSNCEDFQARRANIKFKGADGKNRLVHILNGSGTALARLYVALLETYQQADGSVKIPEPLVPYMGGLREIRPV
jgi:seryl-tRNA synthetase